LDPVRFMPTTYNDQFYRDRPLRAAAGGDVAGRAGFDLIDQDDDGDIDRFNNDSVDGFDVQSSYPGDTVTVNLSGGGSVTYTGITFYLADGREVFTPTDGRSCRPGHLPVPAP
jgi:hypothetical protein